MISKPLNKKKRSIQAPLLVFISAFLLFANTIPHKYAWDDKIVIEKNPRVQKGITGIPDLFIKHTSQYQYDQYGFRPIALSSFAIDYSISKGDPSFSHFMNVFYNAILSVLIFLFLSSLFSGYHYIFSLLITLLYISHPLHVEVVANIKSRDEILGLLFSIISLIYFLKFLKETKPFYLLWVSISYLLAYLSKENSITLLASYPLIFLIHKLFISKKAVIVYFASFVVLLSISFIIYKYAETSKSDAQISEGLGIYQENGILGNSFLFVGSFWTKIANALHILLLYLKNFLLPFPLVYYYGSNMIPSTSWANPWVWLSLCIHVGAIVLGIQKIKQRPEILFGFLFYLISISVFTHIVRPLSDTMADRFMFTASFGLCIFFIGLLGFIFKVDWKELTDKKTNVTLSIKGWISKYKSIVGVLGLFIITFSFLSFSRNRVWKDDLTLVKHDLPYMENCSRAHFYYATLLKTQITEHPDKRSKLESTMIKHYKRSMEISDYAYRSYLELGSYYCKIGNYSEGNTVLKKGVKLFPEAGDISFSLGQTYLILNQNDSAVRYFEQSIKLAYNNPSNYYFLGIAYSKVNRLNDAIEIIKNGLDKFPNKHQMMFDALSHIYFNTGYLDKSIEATFKEVELGKPLQAGYKDIIARCYAVGEKEKGDKYKEEARLKGIIFN
jgi:hypothetical protein